MKYTTPQEFFNDISKILIENNCQSLVTDTRKIKPLKKLSFEEIQAVSKQYGFTAEWAHWSEPDGHDNIEFTPIKN